MIHFDFDNKQEVEAFVKIATRAPKATFIVAHMMGSSMQKLPTLPKNVLIEVSGLPLAPDNAGPFFVQLWRGFGMERVLFGSDWPLLHPVDHLDWLKRLPLTDAERQLILVDNPARILGPG